jgi:hypothetical protein
VEKRSLREQMRRTADQAFAPPPPPPPKDAIYLGKHPVTGEYVYILPSDLDTHVEFVGGSRKGKSNALRRLVKALIRRKKEYGEGFSIIDPHGVLAQYALELCAKDPALAADVLYLTLADVEYVLSINPVRRAAKDPYYQAACVREGLIHIFDQTKSQDKKLVSRVLTNLHQAQIEGNLTLLESGYFLNRGPIDEAVLQVILSRLPATSTCLSFWRHQQRRADRDADVYSLGPANRLDDLIRPPVLRRMLGQDHVSVDFLEVMNRGGIAIFDTSIGEGTEITADGQALFNALLVQHYRQAFPSRTPKGSRNYDPKKTPPHTLIMDEFGSYCSTEFSRLLTEASKFGLRCVFSHQNLQQLVPPDGDMQLKNAVLAIPNKVVFGNLPFEEAKELATHMYLADLDPEQIKYKPKPVIFEPVVQWGVTARTETHGRSVGSARGTTRGRASTHASSIGSSAGTSAGEDGEHTTRQEGTNAGESFNESESESENLTDTRARSHTVSVTEGYHTTYKERVQDVPPVYRSVEEQVFKAAQVLSLNEKGVAVIGTERRKPLLCRFPNMDQRPVSEDELGAFLKEVYRKPVYVPRDEADRRIEERQAKLLEEAKPQEELPASRAKQPARKRKPRLPS